MTTNSFFFEELSTPAQRQDLMKSEVWHIVVAAMNVAPGELKIGSISKDYNDMPEVKLLSNEGVLVAAINTTSGRRGKQFGYAFGLTHSDTLTKNAWTELRSSRSKYVASKVRSKNEDAGGLSSKVEGAVVRAKNAKHHLAYDAMMRAIKKLYGRAPDTLNISLDSELTTTLARVFMGDLLPTQVPSHQASLITSQFNTFKQRQQKLSESLDVVREFFARDKWVLITDYVEGIKDSSSPVIVGSFSGLPIVAAIDEFIRTGEFPHVKQGNSSFAYALNPDPLKVYASFDHIPDEMRKAIEVELMMYKISRNSEDLIPKIVGGTCNLWQEGGVLNWSEYSDGTILFMDK